MLPGENTTSSSFVVFALQRPLSLLVSSLARLPLSVLLLALTVGAAVFFLLAVGAGRKEGHVLGNAHRLRTEAANLLRGRVREGEGRLWNWQAKSKSFKKKSPFSHRPSVGPIPCIAHPHGLLPLRSEKHAGVGWISRLDNTSGMCMCLIYFFA